MTRSIDYYFSSHSPWTYLGHAAFLAVARRHGCAIRYRPVPLQAVFEESGGLPLARRHPVRQRYRLVELQRWREKRGVRLVLQPKVFPVDPSLADRFLLAIVAQGGDPSQFMASVMASVWVEERDISQPATIASLASEAGFDPAVLAREAESEGIAERYRGTIALAIEAGVFGAPSYVLDGEVFWGQDRIELLDEALASGRGAFTPQTGG